MGLRRLSVSVLSIIIGLLSVTPPVYAQEISVIRARVVAIEEEGERSLGDIVAPYQRIKIEFTSGEHTGGQRIITHGETFTLQPQQMVKVGDAVIIEVVDTDGEEAYRIIDRYRLPSMAIIIVAFIVLILVLSRWQGVGSLAGLVVSFVVIMLYIVPAILRGDDPVMTSIIGAATMLVVTMYLAHGWSVRSHVAVVSTIISLVVTGILSTVFVSMTQLSGLGSEEAYSLTIGGGNIANFQGLLLGGMILGALGVLDDVTSAQSAAVFELFGANSKLTMQSLFWRGIRIGREHISSLVNTLVLAYAGASLPLFLMFVINPANMPVWLILNNEFVAEEIVRTLSGSFGLVLAVPITTLLAAYIAPRVPHQHHGGHRH